MFGIAFGVAFFLLFLVLLLIAQKVGVSVPLANTPPLNWFVIVVVPVAIGFLAQAGLEVAIDRHAKH